MQIGKELVWRKLDINSIQDTIEAWNILSNAYKIPVDCMRQLIPFTIIEDIDVRLFFILIRGTKNIVGVAGGYVWPHLIEYNVAAILKQYRGSLANNAIRKIYNKEFDIINKSACAICRNNGVHTILNTTLTPLALVVNACLLHKTLQPESLYFYAQFKEIISYYFPKCYYNLFRDILNEAGCLQIKISELRKPLHLTKLRIIKNAFYEKDLILIDRVGLDIYKIIFKLIGEGKVILAYSMQDQYINFGVKCSKKCGFVACGVMCFSALDSNIMLPRFCLQYLENNDISDFFQIKIYDYKYSYLNKIISYDLKNTVNWS